MQRLKIKMEKEEKRTHNSTNLKVAVRWINQALCLVDSEVLQNCDLWVVAKCYRQL